jgi:hypothetical protein
MSEQTTSPVEEEATTIAELFARDPHEHTKQSLAQLVSELRKRRARFKVGDKTAGSAKAPSKTAAKQSAAMSINKDLLNDLDL